MEDSVEFFLQRISKDVDDDFVDRDIDDGQNSEDGAPCHDKSFSQSFDEEPRILAEESQPEDLHSDFDRNSEDDYMVLVEETHRKLLLR